MRKRSLAIVGFVICGIAATLMVADVLSVGWGSAVGMIGIGLIAAAAGASDG